MPKYTYEVEMVTTITVDASSEEAATDLIRDKLDQAPVTFGTWDNGDPIIGDVTLYDDAPTLSSADEEDSN